MVVPDFNNAVLIENPVTNLYKVEFAYYSGLVIAQSMQMLEEKYGPYGLRPLDYHCPEHSGEMVLGNFRRLGRAALEDRKITYIDFELGKMAAATHDIDQDATEPEKVSGITAGELMRQYDIFTDDDVFRVQTLIAATVLKSVDENGIKQSENDNDILAKCLVDADVCAIGMEWPVARIWVNKLYTEKYKKTPDLADPDYITFLELEHKVFSGHGFKSTYGQREYTHLKSNAQAIQKMLDA